jgi:hypothetical protein
VGGGLVSLLYLLACALQYRCLNNTRESFTCLTCLHMPFCTKTNLHQLHTSHWSAADHYITRQLHTSYIMHKVHNTSLSRGADAMVLDALDQQFKLWHTHV